MSIDYDTIIVGGGGAGISAAITSVQSGARTLLVDAATKLGGSTVLSGGVFYAAGTAIQRACGITDSPAAMYHHYMTLNRYGVSPPLVKKLCVESSGTLDWLISLGVGYTKDGLYFSGCDEVPRGHRPVGAGAEIIECLEGALSQYDVDIALATRITGLVANDDGTIEGVRVGDEVVKASSVILATGGFGANVEMLAKHFPDSAMGGEYLWYVGAETCRGDGLEFGAVVGAQIAGENRGLLSVTHGFARDNEVEQPGWLVHVNKLGQRFVDETLSYAMLAHQVKMQPGHECFSIFDEMARISLKSANPRQPCWQKDLLLQYLERGYFQKAENLSGLADLLDIPSVALENTVTKYNSYCTTGTDQGFFKRADYLRPISTPPFYGTRLKPAILGLTATGLRIDQDAKVIDADGQWIKGLFAAGETTGGIIGDIYTASGNSIANAIIFGRTAGFSAATHGRAS